MTASTPPASTPHPPPPAPPPHLDAASPELGRWFPPVDFEAWEAEARRALKGRAPAALASVVPGIGAVPVAFDPAAPQVAVGGVDAPPFVRGAGAADRVVAGWDVRALLDGGLSAAESVGLGARSVWAVGAPAGLDAVDLAAVPVDVEGGDDPAGALRVVEAAWAAQGVAADARTGAVAADLWRVGAPAVATHLAALEASPWVHGVRVDGLTPGGLGADLPTRLGLAWAELVGVLRALAAEGVAPAAVAPRVLLRWGVGGDVIVELAALRALRAGVSRVLVACGVAPSEARVFVHAVAAPWAHSRVEPWTNVLRDTGAAVAAVAGGADALTLLPRTLLSGTPDPAASRLALTAAAVLREEAHLAAVADPGGGARVVEHLTDALGRAGWAVLQGVEAEGGFTPDLAAARAAACAAVAAERVATGKAPLVGVTAFARPDADLLPSGAPAVLVGARPAAPVEALRERVAALRAAWGRPPRVVLVTVGPPSAGQRARLGFAAGWYAAAGLATEVAAPAEVGAADAVCLCGDDDAYEGAAAVLATLLAPVRELAGRPGAREAALREAGLTGAIWLGGDLVAGLDAVIRAWEA